MTALWGSHKSSRGSLTCNFYSLFEMMPGRPGVFSWFMAEAKLSFLSPPLGGPLPFLRPQSWKVLEITYLNLSSY